MSKRKRAGRVAEHADGGARLPSRIAAARPTGGSARWSARGTAGDWLLLPGGTWRRVETIRVQTLFG
ncbi:hypothetical protein ACGFYV_05185 [Streptomyces sp. NPDC048297]|uniref:hypothetical protein n=1 Tax=Streptomyces sp. NPDC048297 TaxID=3365531 RepID=UPI0037131EC9